MAGGVSEMVEKAKKMGIGAMDSAKAGADLAGAVVKTAFKRATWNDSPTKLKPETEKFLNMSTGKK